MCIPLGGHSPTTQLHEETDEWSEILDRYRDVHAVHLDAIEEQTLFIWNLWCSVLAWIDSLLENLRFYGERGLVVLIQTVLLVIF